MRNGFGNKAWLHSYCKIDTYISVWSAQLPNNASFKNEILKFLFFKSRGTLLFRSGVGTQAFRIKIIDNDVFQEDRHFYVRLVNLRVTHHDGSYQIAPSLAQAAAGLAQPVAGKIFPIKIDSPTLATVMILDDDHHGM